MEAYVKEFVTNWFNLNWGKCRIPKNLADDCWENAPEHIKAKQDRYVYTFMGNQTMPSEKVRGLAHFEIERQKAERIAAANANAPEQANELRRKAVAAFNSYKAHIGAEPFGNSRHEADACARAAQRYLLEAEALENGDAVPVSIRYAENGNGRPWCPSAKYADRSYCQGMPHRIAADSGL